MTGLQPSLAELLPVVGTVPTLKPGSVTFVKNQVMWRATARRNVLLKGPKDVQVPPLVKVPNDVQVLPTRLPPHPRMVRGFGSRPCKNNSAPTTPLMTMSVSGN